ncbi:MAG: cyclase family protein [Cyclobacteriaceae bacterium]
MDLTYSFDNTTVFWPTASDFKLTVDFAGTTESGYYYEANTFALAEHGGTHIDAPIHFAEGRQSVDQISLNNLMGNGIVVDISEPALQNRDYLLSVDDLEEWESSNGSIMEGTIVLVRTGYGRYWPDREKYMGTAERGAEAVADLHFPGIHPDAAAWLAEKNVKAVGIDTPSIDYGQSKDFKAHQTLYLKNIPGFENVANLDQLPEKGFTIIALPMKINNGSGGPLRIIAAM